MAGSLYGRLFGSPKPPAHRASLLDRIIPPEAEQADARRLFPEVEKPLESGRLTALREAPAPPGADASPMERTQFGLDRSKWERGQQRVEKQTEQLVGTGAPTSFADYATRNAGGEVPLSRVGEIDLDRGIREAADQARLKAADDDWWTVIRKTGENLDDRIGGRGGGGIIQALPEIRRVIQQAMPAGQLAALATDMLAAPLDENAREIGKGIFERATAELERNAPDVANSPGKAFASDLFNVFVDLGTAVGASVLTRSPSVGSALLGTQVFADRFGESISQGRTDREAFQDGAFYAVAEMVGEKAVIGGLMKPGASFLGRVGQGALAEGVQESVTETLQTGYDMGVLNADMTMGEALNQVARAGLLGAAAGGGVGAITHPFVNKEVESPPAEPGIAPAPFEFTPPPPAPGVVETARANAAQPTEADERSPIPTDIIAAGRSMVEGAKAETQVNAGLTALGLPAIGKRVVVDYGGGRLMIGTMEDVYERDDTDLGKASGVRIKLDDGSILNEMLPDIMDAGVSIRGLEEALATSEPVLEAPVASTAIEVPDPVVVGRPSEQSARLPLPVQGRVTSEFGQRAAPKAGASRNHGGIDIAAPVGTPIAAPADGVVANVGSGGARGNWVEIDHGNGLVSRYFHLDSAGVAKGDAVAAGQEIAKSGKTGNVTGPHLHWSVLKDGVAVDPLTSEFATGQVQADGRQSDASEQPGTDFLSGPLNTARAAAAPVLPAEPAPADRTFMDEAAAPTAPNLLPEAGNPNATGGRVNPASASRDVVAQPIVADVELPSVERQDDKPLLRFAARIETEGKKLVIRDADEAALASIRSVLPPSVRPLPRADGSLTLPVKYQDDVKAIATRKEIGTNAQGGIVLEDSRGVRSVVIPPTDANQGASFTEAFPRRDGQAAPDLAARDPQFLTVTEEATRAEVRPESLVQLRSAPSQDAIEAWVSEPADQPERLARAGEAAKIFPALAPRLESSTTAPATPANLEGGDRPPLLGGGAQPFPSTSNFATVKIGNSEFPFTSLKEVSENYRRTIDNLDVGASKTPAATIRDSGGNVVANVAYNGRVFAVDQGGERGDILFQPSWAQQPPARIDIEKSTVVIRQADDATLSSIRAALPANVKPIPRADGALTLPKRYENAVRKAVEDQQAPAASSVMSPVPLRSVTPQDAELDLRRREVEAVTDSSVRFDPDTEASTATNVAAARKIADRLPTDPPMDENAERLWQQAVTAMELTQAEKTAVRTTARSIAALAGRRDGLGRVHVAEALSYVQDWRARSEAGRGKLDARVATERQIDELLPRAQEAQAELASFGAAFGDKFTDPGAKSRERIIEKVEREGYAGPEDLKDLARGAVVVDSMEEADAIVAQITSTMQVERDKGWVELPGSGYVDRKIIVRMGNGLRGEIQIVPRPVWQAKKDGNNQLYDRARVSNDREEADRLNAQQRENYAAALSGSPFANLSSSARSASGNALANSARESGTPSVEALATSPGASRQPSDQTQAAEDLPDQTRPTPRSSTSNNSNADTGDTSDPDIGETPTRSKVPPSANRIFTEDAAERARRILREKFNQTNAGLDPELVQAGITLAGYHIEKGARSFAAYSKAMIADMGNAVRPYLRGWYEAIRHYPGMEASAADMSNAEDIGAALADLNRVDVTPAPEGGNIQPQEAESGVQVPVSSGDARASAEDVQSAPKDRGDGSTPESQERGSPPLVGGPDGSPSNGIERSTSGYERSEIGRGDRPRDPDRVPAGEPAADGRGRREDTSSRIGSGVAADNWRIEPGTLSEARGPAVKARDNVRAIEIVKELDASGLPATREQQEALAKYVGWGGLKNAFAESGGSFPKGFETIGPRIKELLTEAEYKTARQSIQYAHYTSEKVVRPMWEAAQRLGFTGGKVFEPGMGTGNFAGMMPPELAAKSQYWGLEFDYVTARIAQLLYPKAGVQHADYTKVPMPQETFDLVIGNPPFSQTVIKSDPAYAKHGFVLHDFFFAKSLDAVRPGGLLMFVTSAGTMNKIDTAAREYLAERADLVGAVRLPGDAFQQNAGTSVTTDIVILRKKDARDRPEDIPWAGDRSWVETTTAEMTAATGGMKKGAVSRYFVDRPEMVLGEPGFFDKLYPDRYAVRARPNVDLPKALSQALTGRHIPADVMTMPSTQLQADGSEFGGRERKDGSFYLAPNGRLMQQRGNVGVPVEARGKGVKGGIPAKDQERIKALIPIRDALRSVFAHDLADAKAEGDAARKALNVAYDKFVAAFGPINKAEISHHKPTVIQQEVARNIAREEARLAGGFFGEGSFDPSDLIARNARSSEIAAARRQAKEAADALGREWNEGDFDGADMPDLVIVKRPNIDAFMDDQEGYRLRAIERYNDDTGQAKKGNVFFENIISKEREPQINSAQDALLYSLNRLGRPDLDEIALRANLSRSQVLEELRDSIYKVPGQGETYQTRELYLSGNVRQKLETARAEAARDPAFQRNVEALEAVQPTPLGPADISANLGMPWIPTKVIETFATEGLGLNKATVRYRGRLAQWSVDGDRASAAARSTWGTSNRDAITLLSDALNRQDPKVMQKVRDPESGREKDVIDPEATQAAQDKMRDIKARFLEWVWSDTARADELAALYNRDFNNLVAPEYDGSYLTTPGIASWWNWRPHQSRVVARIIQAGNTYMAHGVGAGKTSAMIGAGMEMRRLGLVRKPMYAVPNHMLGQFTKEFYEQYPTAKIMVADERRFHTDRRKQFVANMAAEDLDAVIITHSAFGYIPISDDFSDQLLQNQLDDYRDILSEVKADDTEGGRGDRITQRRIEQQIESMEQKLTGRSGRKDQVFTFEETGVDFLFVDEAHLFRKLDFATKMGNVRGIDPNGSQASYDLFAKTRYLESRQPGRSLVLASGTPITNTMAELFSLSRYLQPQALAERGLQQFDAWAGAFGDTVTALEQDPAGGYKPQTRFAKFLNVPELSAMVRQIMDVVTSKQLEEFVVRPKLKDGKRKMVVAEPTPELERYQGALTRRMEAIQRRSGPPKKGDDILLSVIGDGRKAAIDMRLVDPRLPASEASKLEQMIGNVVRIAKETKRKGFHKVESTGYSEKPYRYGPATQMVFSDLGINGDFPIHKYIATELVKRGIPRSQVAIISDYKNHVARQRLFNDVNEGKVRVLIGSAAKMGTGVNAQRQLYAIHNLDPQWYPANDEQRNGRGLRQGNENPEIEITDYSTKATYDSTMWGLMETKARFIEGFFAGDPTMRSMDDLGEASQYEQAKAITTADPRILEMTQYKQDLERSLIRKAAFEREQYALRDRIRSAEDGIARLSERIPQIEVDIAGREDIAGDAFTAKVGKDTFTDRGEFGDAVLARLAALTELKVTARDKPVAEIGGFKLTADVTTWDRQWDANLFLNREGGYQEKVKSETSAGVSSSAAAILRGFEADLDKARDGIGRYQATIDEFTPQVGKEFIGQAEIDELRRKADAIEAELTAEAAAKAAGPVPQPQAEPEVKEARATRERRAGNDAAEFDVPFLEAEMKAELERSGIADRVTLNATTQLWGDPRVWGRYSPQTRIITVAIDRTPDALGTLNHEIVHAFRDLSLFRPAEWTALGQRARSDKKLWASVQERYPDLSEEQQIEEAVADMYASWRTGSYDPKGFIRLAFERIRNFLEALRTVLLRAGVNAEDVMAAIASGEMGSRPGTEPPSARSRAAKFEMAAATPSPTTVSAILRSARTLRSNAAETFDEWRTAAQDRMLPLLRTQQAAERVLRRPLREDENPYIGEELMSGKVGAQLERLADDMVGPLFEAMSEEGVTVDELESYLYARHAPERNKQIGKINPEFADGRGSGMSDIEASAIIARIEKAGKLQKMERVAERVDGILQFAVDTRREAGLLSDEQVDAWRSTYQHYVPLRGFAELDGTEADAARPSDSGGINVRGPESRRAFGRRSKADDILAYSIMQAEEAIIRAEKNMVARQLYDLAVAAPDPDFWIANKVTMKRQMNPLSGQVEYVPVRNLLAVDKDWTVSLKIDGKERRVTMDRTNPAARRLAEAMRRLDEQQVGKLVQFFGKVNRWLSAANTSFNPEFVITNAFRDIQTAGINLAGFDRKGLIAGTLKDYRKAMAASMRGAFKSEKGDATWTKWYQEFLDAGGRVYFNQVQDLDTLRKDIERRVASMQKKNLSPASLALHARGALSAVGGFIGSVNNGVENAIRLSAYKNARERGMTEVQAASLAKNLTVNFNRRGSAGTTMNALYLFYNASIQGSVRLLTAIKSRRVQKLLAGVVATGAAIEAYNMMVSGVDDDDELMYDKISSFEKSRNLIIMIPGGDNGQHIKIPLPYGYNAFYAIGRSAVELSRGKPLGTTLGNLGGTIVDSFNPIGGTGDLLSLEGLATMVSPTVVDPVVDLVTNKDFAGRPIMPQQNPYGPPTPDNQRYWGSVNPIWRGVTDGLNKISGGDDVRPGAVDVSPETLEHLFGVVTGAAGAFYDRTAGLGVKAWGVAAGDESVEIERNDVPLVRKIVGEKPGWYDRSAFYARTAHVEQAIAYAKEYAEKGDREGFMDFMGESLGIVSVEPPLKRAQKHMRAVRKERNRLIVAHESGKVNATAYRERSRILGDIEKRVMADFNSAYMASVETPAGPD